MSATLDAARAALAACTEAERRALFRELGLCACALAAEAVRSSSVARGAAVGALVGGLFAALAVAEGPEKREEKKR